MKRHISRCPQVSWLLAVALALAAQLVWAGGNCSLSVQGVSFGSYDVFSNSNLDSTGTISINCDQFNSFEMSLSPGGGTYASRSMASGANRLNYNLYTDAARTTVWGDGTGGTAIVTAGGTSASRTVYGRIPAKQNAFVGNYSDVVIATVEF